MGLYIVTRMGTIASPDHVAGAEYEGHFKNISQNCLSEKILNVMRQV
jgi:hypothetical protein